MAPAAQTPQPGQAAPTAQAPQQEQMAPAAQAQAPATPKGQILPAKGLFTKQGYDPETNTVQLGGMFDFAGQPLKNIATAQEIIGEKKWQKGDKEKTKFEAGKDIKLKHMELETELAKTNAATALENEKHARTVLDKIAEPITLSGEALDKKAGITEITDNAQKLLARLKGDPSTLRTLGLPGDEKGQETLLWANTIKTRSKFMTGGKALTAIENKLIDQISTSTGLKAFLQNPGTQMKILEGILEKTKGYQRELDPYMEERNFLNKARASGKYSDAEILSMLHVKRGRKTDAKAK
jgi:hypothetical protein